MLRTRFWLVALLPLLAALGCGASADNPSSDEGEPAEQVVTDARPEPTGPDPDAKPDVIVAAFLDGLKQSDEEAVANLMTDKAREAAKSSDILDPSGDPAMTYEIQKVEYPKANKQTAHVFGTWTQPGPDGDLVMHEVTWVLRKQADGWRVAGVAAPISEGEPPVFFNFENPDEMFRKEDEAEAELARRSEETVRQADHTDAVREPVRRR